MATMNISLPNAMKEWVEHKIESGRYANTSDYVRDLIRKEQDRESIIQEIQAALDEGDASGYLPYAREELEQTLKLSAGKDAA